MRNHANSTFSALLRASARAGVACLATFVCLAFAPAAEAVPVTFQVTNQNGMTQPSGFYEGGFLMGETNASGPVGQVTIDRPAGQAVSFSRAYLGSDPACRGPEGTGQSYTFPAAAPAGPVSIVLPNAQQGAPSNPGLVNDERWLLGKINAERAKVGAAPLQNSGALSDAADRYANLLNSTGAKGHCVAGDSMLRAIEAGWPLMGVGEDIAYGANAVQAFNAWMASDLHRNAMLAGKYASAGIGVVGNRQVLMLGKSCAGHAAADRCRMTGDFGDPNLPISDGQTNPTNPGDDSVAPALKRSGLKVLSVARKGRRLRITVGTKTAAKGSVSLTAKRGSKRARVSKKASRRGKTTFYVSLKKAGKYKIGLRFKGRSGWRNATVCRSVKVKSMSRKSARRYVRIKARGC